MDAMRFLPFVIPIVLAIYCWIELAQSDARDVRLVPRWAWAFVIAFPLIGPVSWLVYGRPNGERPAPRRLDRTLARWPRMTTPSSCAT